MKKRNLNPIITVTAYLVITGFLLVIIEGLGSFAISLYQVVQAPQAEQNRYDKKLGWISLPNANIPDMYGPGVYVRTNSRGFRNEEEIKSTAPVGKFRIICSGDSFTFGQGVANNRTWCHLISKLDARFEVVNLGCTGYGVDQMYLRYLRDGVVLEHDIHIFAFVNGDLDRMGRNNQVGYGKPILQIKNGTLIPDGVPVPRFRWSVNRTIERAGFRTVDFANRFFSKLSKVGRKNERITESVGPVASAVFDNIQKIGKDKNVIVIFVFLPTEGDIRNDSEWRLWTTKTMETKGLQFVDLTPQLRSIPAADAASFFILHPNPAAGHYTDAGNKWVADRLYRQFLNISQIQELLAETSPTK